MPLIRFYKDHWIGVVHPVPAHVVDGVVLLDWPTVEPRHIRLHDGH